MNSTLSWRSLVNPIVIVLSCLIHCSWGQGAQPASMPVFVPKITISKEATWGTEPLDERGFVVDFEAINRRFSAGVTPENNAVVPEGRREREVGEVLWHNLDYKHSPRGQFLTV